MHLKILFLKMEYFTFSCTGLTNDFRFSNTHISPSKTHFAMPISLYLKRPLPSILSVLTFTVYSIDIWSFTELKRIQISIFRVLSGNNNIKHVHVIRKQSHHSNDEMEFIFLHTSALFPCIKRLLCL